jgi:hypothetical protein
MHVRMTALSNCLLLLEEICKSDVGDKLSQYRASLLFAIFNVICFFLIALFALSFLLFLLCLVKQLIYENVYFLCKWHGGNCIVAVGHRSVYHAAAGNFEILNLKFRFWCHVYFTVYILVAKFALVKRVCSHAVVTTISVNARFEVGNLIMWPTCR